MPFTPIHFGPGAAIKALLPGHFSFAVFALAQVLIDLEPLALWVVTGDPVHPYLHTWLGAALVAALAYAPGRRIAEWGLRAWNARLDAAQGRWLAFGPGIGKRAAFWGAVLGAYSHVALDGIMHADMRPLAPFSDARPWLGALSIESLHLLCLAAGGLALVALAFLRWRRAL